MIQPDQWERVKRILGAAIELPYGERQVFIEKESGGDEVVRNEVTTLLEAHDEAGTFIASPIASVADFVDVTTDPPIVGKEIGSYKVVAEIGRGGMGSVYLAERADAEFKKQVALKLIKRGLDTDEIIERFRNERQILANLEHPNIARLIDGGATDDGRPYLVMEYVEGVKLTEFCQDLDAGIDKRLDLFLAVCSAVSHAHRNLVVHRDLKPSNILVTGEGRPKLLDFGIAKLLTPSSDMETRGTAANTNVMTPEYASPEQVSGEIVTTQSDVYSLGVILYELLCGSRPYDFDSRSLDRIVRTVCEFEPVRPSSRSTLDRGTVARTLRGDLDNIVLMAIRKEPERRYTSVEQLAEDIRRFRAGLPVIAREDTFGYRASKFIRRNRAGVTAALGIGVSLVGGMTMTLRQSRIARRQRDKAERVNRFLQRMLASADPRAVGKDAKVAEVLAIAADAIETEFSNQPDIVADLSTTVGLTFLSLGQVDSAEPHLEQALNVRTDLLGPTHPDTAVSLNNLGKLVHAKGDLETAEHLFRRSLQIFRGERRVDPRDVSSVLGDLGYLLMVEGKYLEAAAMHHEELEILRSTVGERHAEFARSLGHLGNVYAALNDRRSAESMHRRALDITRRFYKRDHPDVAQAQLHLAIPLQADNPDEAEALCRDSLAMRERFFGEGHIETAWSRYHLGGVLLRKGNNREAIQCADDILRFRRDAIPDKHSVIHSSLLLLARAYLSAGRPGDAEPLLRECIHLREATLPPGHWLIDAARGYLGECLGSLDRTTEARQLVEQAYSALAAKLGTDHEHTRRARQRLDLLS